MLLNETAERAPFQSPPPVRDIIGLGQVFTPRAVVQRMLALRRNHGRTLEPSCGDGAFSSQLADCVAIELDARVAPRAALKLDFFDYPAHERFDTIIGNPPYVRFQDIAASTRAKLCMEHFDARSNLYLFFIEKCVRHLNDGGELIFITPRDFIKATGARKLNKLLFDAGSITDFIDLGDARVFEDAIPNCAIFRFEKGRLDRRMNDGRIFHFHDGQLAFLSGSYSRPLSDFFSVKVGAVSGADHIFEHPQGDTEFVCSRTNATGELRRMIYAQPHPHLLEHKEALLARRVRHFDERNWWKWGREHFKSAAPRIYVNGKTRQPRPFFVHHCRNYDGSILALFPHDATVDVHHAAALLNGIHWNELGFVCDGRFLFTQRSLETCLLPEDFPSRLSAC